MSTTHVKPKFVVTAQEVSFWLAGLSLVVMGTLVWAMALPVVGLPNPPAHVANAIMEVAFATFLAGFIAYCAMYRRYDW